MTRHGSSRSWRPSLRSAGTRQSGSERRERERRDRWHERRDVWRRMPTPRRESLLFTALGDERLTIREIALRMNAQLGYAAEDRVVPEYETRPLVGRLFRKGHVEREPETFNKTRTRYRYFRNRGSCRPDRRPRARLPRRYGGGVMANGAIRRPRGNRRVARHAPAMQRDSLELPLRRDRLSVRSDPRRSYRGPATHAAAV